MRGRAPSGIFFIFTIRRGNNRTAERPGDGERESESVKRSRRTAAAPRARNAPGIKPPSRVYQLIRDHHEPGASPARRLGRAR